MSFRQLALLPAVATIAVSLGCSGAKPAVKRPDFEPAAMGKKAIEIYDGNGDGALDKTELEKCPAILSNITLYDKNSDGKVDAEEIAARLQKFIDEKAPGVSTPACRIVKMQNGQKVPVVGAIVKFVPEKFMAEILKEGTSTEPSSDSGVVMVSIPESERREGEKDLPGMYPGLYKVEITHPTEKIDPKYSGEKTVFGQDVPDPSGGTVEYVLK